MNSFRYRQSRVIIWYFVSVLHLLLLHVTLAIFGRRTASKVRLISLLHERENGAEENAFHKITHPWSLRLFGEIKEAAKFSSSSLTVGCECFSPTLAPHTPNQTNSPVTVAQTHSRETNGVCRIVVVLLRYVPWLDCCFHLKATL